MRKMSLLQSSCQADNSCVVFCRSHANLLLKALNPNCEAALMKVYGEDGEVYYVWADINPQDKEGYFSVVFAGEADIIPAIEDVRLINAGEAFNHEGNFYVVVRNKCGDIVIRTLNVLSNEKLLREVMADDADIKDIVSVSLSKFFVIGHGKEFLTLVWALVCGDNSVVYVPVLNKDLPLVEKYSLGSLLKEPAVLGMPVKLHDKFYTPMQDKDGKLYLSCDKNLRLYPRYQKR